ncbi:hypothetical protein, partial [Geobacillus sp. BK01]|uniref:hypothetical protein n=1 Tax=Geobacillus sp. BK01 TaxID=3457328 RepID=UPI003FA60D68
NTAKGKIRSWQGRLSYALFFVPVALDDSFSPLAGVGQGRIRLPGCLAMLHGMACVEFSSNF